MTDEELILSYQKGNEEAFNELYRKYSPMVYAYIKKRLRESEVEDFYQKVWRHLHEKKDLCQNRPFAPWFFVLIRHLLIDEYRSLGRRKEFQSKFLENLRIDITPIEETDLGELLATLDSVTADLVRKYYIEGISYEDLALANGLSQAGLRQRLSRALRGIREKVRGVG